MSDLPDNLPDALEEIVRLRKQNAALLAVVKEAEQYIRVFWHDQHPGALLAWMRDVLKV